MIEAIVSIIIIAIILKFIWSIFSYPHKLREKKKEKKKAFLNQAISKLKGESNMIVHCVWCGNLVDGNCYIDTKNGAKFVCNVQHGMNYIAKKS